MTDRGAFRRIRLLYAQLTEFERGRIIGLCEKGWSYYWIGHYLNRPERIVRMCYNYWELEEPTHAEWQTTRREDFLIERQAMTKATASSSAIHVEVVGALQIPALGQLL